MLSFSYVCYIKTKFLMLLSDNEIGNMYFDTLNTWKSTEDDGEEHTL